MQGLFAAALVVGGLAFAVLAPAVWGSRVLAPAVFVGLASIAMGALWAASARTKGGGRG